MLDLREKRVIICSHVNLIYKEFCEQRTIIKIKKLGGLRVHTSSQQKDDCDGHNLETNASWHAMISSPKRSTTILHLTECGST